jgi:hypothetical protein
MFAKWVSVFLSVGGLILNVLGLFLPWAEASLKPYLIREGSPILGIDTHVGGFFSSIGVVVAVVSWVLVMARKPKPLLALAVGGGIWIMTCAWAWIVSPGTLFGATLASWAVYTTSYGAYVSLAGGALAFVGAAMALCQSSLPSVPPGLKSSLRRRKLGIAAFVVGLAVGLVLGVFSSVALLPAHKEPSWKSAVLVSGTISETQPHNGTIYFDSMDIGNTVSTKANITDGKYSVLLVGGLCYIVSFYVSDYHHPAYSHTLYVPSNVTTFTANF